MPEAKIQMRTEVYIAHYPKGVIIVEIIIVKATPKAEVIIFFSNCRFSIIFLKPAVKVYKFSGKKNKKGEISKRNMLLAFIKIKNEETTINKAQFSFSYN